MAVARENYTKMLHDKILSLIKNSNVTKNVQ